MCVSIPSLVLSLNGFVATVEAMGVQREVNTQMLLEPIAPGDYVTVMAGSFATKKLDPTQAQETLSYFAEIAASLPQ